MSAVNPKVLPAWQQATAGACKECMRRRNRQTPDVASFCMAQALPGMQTAVTLHFPSSFLMQRCQSCSKTEDLGSLITSWNLLFLRRETTNAAQCAHSKAQTMYTTICRAALVFMWRHNVQVTEAKALCP